MSEETEQSIARRAEYSLRVPKVPRQSVDVFARDVQNGSYGLSSQKVDTLLSYVTLQHTLGSFEDLTFTPDFIKKLPDKLQEKLSDNLYPGISLSHLEIPTTDKVLVTRMLAADRLTEALSEASVEVWVTPEIKKQLVDFNCVTDTGLRLIDYTQLSLEAKSYLVEVMEGQEHQAHTILAAKCRFPEGVPPLGFAAMFFGKGGRTKFDTLEDLEAQYKAAQQALDNPLLLWFSEIIEKDSQQTSSSAVKKRKAIHSTSSNPNKLSINVEAEAKGQWWAPAMMDSVLPDEDQDKIADYLRSRYAGKTIYAILDADSPETQEEILAAFWRTDSPKQIDFGDEPWMKYGLYLRADGILELHFMDDLYGEREISPITGLLGSTREVAMVDQTVKWIEEETTKMQKVKEAWGKSGFGGNATLESTLAATLGINQSPELQAEIDGLPKWFFDALNQEVLYYSHFINYSPRLNLEDFFTLLGPKDKSDKNRLKSYFDLANVRLQRDKRLIVNPTELYKDLDLNQSANQDEARRAYRRIAKETMAIQVSSPEEFDPEAWKAMNERFIKAAKAYAAISKQQFGESRLTTLGRLSNYFKTEN